MTKLACVEIGGLVIGVVGASLTVMCRDAQSITAQKREIRSYCERNSLNIDRWERRGNSPLAICSVKRESQPA